jgi:hypothetical protein
MGGSQQGRGAPHAEKVRQAAAPPPALTSPPRPPPPAPRSALPLPLTSHHPASQEIAIQRMQIHELRERIDQLEGGGRPASAISSRPGSRERLPPMEGLPGTMMPMGLDGVDRPRSAGGQGVPEVQPEPPAAEPEPEPEPAPAPAEEEPAAEPEAAATDEPAAEAASEAAAAEPAPE